ncbi:TraE/TraK family type IV conjugative transfer system protein [Cupriavidus malaysiensis]|uniref:Sex pilus assembly protein n=1 Tax=Cupriavidus malaysiensis TaxID=367825 RepID=A0ABN4TXJ7_9BURK|nr:TraE/TraK family type IV conjugative transfer system protein [Cupriavidus malaysiensis]AOZ11201.1 hypothetical protein BKK80_35195 [Cupriavidus malaysiensis]
MNFKNLFSTWDNAMGVAKIAMLVAAGSVAVNVLLAVKLVMSHERVTLIPPHLTDKAAVAWKSASGSYKEGIALYVSSMLGSVTPQTALFVADALAYFFDPKIYPSVRTQILSIVDDPNYAKSGTINVFTPQKVFYEASTEKTFVTGVLATTAYRTNATPIGNLGVTYEMIIEIDRGLPRIRRFTSYGGEPHTVKWTQTHKKEADAAAAKAQKGEDINLLPQDAETKKRLEESATQAAAQAAASEAGASAPGASGEPAKDMTNDSAIDPATGGGRTPAKSDGATQGGLL